METLDNVFCSASSEMALASSGGDMVSPVQSNDNTDDSYEFNEDMIDYNYHEQDGHDDDHDVYEIQYVRHENWRVHVIMFHIGNLIATRDIQAIRQATWGLVGGEADGVNVSFLAELPNFLLDNMGEEDERVVLPLNSLLNLEDLNRVVEFYAWPSYFDYPENLNDIEGLEPKVVPIEVGPITEWLTIRGMEHYTHLHDDLVEWYGLEEGTTLFWWSAKGEPHQLDFLVRKDICGR